MNVETKFAPGEEVYLERDSSASAPGEVRSINITENGIEVRYAYSTNGNVITVREDNLRTPREHFEKIRKYAREKLDELDQQESDDTVRNRCVWRDGEGYCMVQGRGNGRCIYHASCIPDVGLCSHCATRIPDSILICTHTRAREEAKEKEHE